MSDADDNKDSSAIPSWQRGAETDGATDDKLEVARRFLEEDGVKDAPREKKVAFLKEKGIVDEEIVKLLGEEETPVWADYVDEQTDETEEQPAPSPPINPPAEAAIKAPTEVTTETSSSPSPSTASSQTTTTTTTTASQSLPQADRPPIVTYPEFLTKPTRPPPLVTTNGLLNTLYAFAGLSTLLYGSSKYIIAPMVETQTESRLDLQATTAAKLEAIVAKLEKTVSEIPSTRHISDDVSEAEDPSELFHRDMGTQTSPLLTPAPTTKNAEPVAKKQAGQLESLTKKLGELKDGVRAQSEDMEDIKTLMDVFRDELDSLTYAGQNDYLAGYDVYGRSRKSEPEDEIKKAKDNIRRVKGVLLSTRNFPASTR
ncbi:Fc.00g031080.m01.CDS01 [Cosmosporella sp. VM-42]